MGCDEVSCGQSISEARDEEGSESCVKGEHGLYAMHRIKRGVGPLTCASWLDQPRMCTHCTDVGPLIDSSTVFDF